MPPKRNQLTDEEKAKKKCRTKSEKKRRYTGSEGFEIA
jgi:hypothetical protein